MEERKMNEEELLHNSFENVCKMQEALKDPPTDLLRRIGVLLMLNTCSAELSVNATRFATTLLEDKIKEEFKKEKENEKMDDDEEQKARLMIAAITRCVNHIKGAQALLQKPPQGTNAPVFSRRLELLSLFGVCGSELALNASRLLAHCIATKMIVHLGEGKIETMQEEEKENECE